MTDNKGIAPNWASGQRYAYIEFRAFWHGRLNRKDLMDKFSISVQQASVDLTTYTAAYPDNIFYSRKTRCYLIKEDTFQPEFISTRSEDYLANARGRGRLAETGRKLDQYL